MASDTVPPVSLVRLSVMSMLDILTLVVVFKVPVLVMRTDDVVVVVFGA